MKIRKAQVDNRVMKLLNSRSCPQRCRDCDRRSVVDDGVLAKENELARGGGDRTKKAVQVAVGHGKE
jgi:hypothetical protein